MLDYYSTAMNDPLKKYRMRFRAWTNKIRLRRELNYYHSKFKARGLIVPDKRTIQETIKSKFPNLIAKHKGSLNILAIYHHYNWENESLKPSLEEFGTVRHYDWIEKFNHQSKDWRKSIKLRMNRDLIQRVKKWVRDDDTDVIFTYLSGEVVTPDTARQIATMGVPMINISLNDKEAFVGKVEKGLARGTRDICRYFDLCWTSTEDALEKYCVEEALPIYLPEGANPETHKPCDEKKTIDVSFVGQCYGNRPGIIQKLAMRGFQVEAYGYGWPNGPLSTQEMVKMYSKSKINLGFGGVAGYKETYCLKGRDFEVPMSAGLYLTEYHPELEKFYDVDKEIMTYTSFDDLVDKINYLLSNLEIADLIRTKGFQRCRNEHSWSKRFEKIFGLMGLIR